MNPYEAARELIRKIENHRVEIGNHQKMIGQLQGDLQLVLKEADLKTSEGAGAPAAKAKAAVAPSAARAFVKRSHKKKVVTPAATPKLRAAAPKREAAPPNATAVKTGKKKTVKARSSRNGSADKPTLGDLVRTVIIQAGRPLKREEIQAGLQDLNYSNSTGNPYRTLGVRLHRLQSRGVVSAGRSQFDVTPQWKQKHKRLIAAAEKKAVSDAAKLPPAPEPAPAQ
jgi:hypothetical protein